MSTRFVFLLKILIGFGTGLIAATAVFAASLWTDLPASQIAARGARLIVPEQGRTMTLNYSAMTDLLAAAPLERDVAAPNSPFELELPLPEGGFGRFRVVESPIMEPELAKRYPTLKTYLGQGIDNPTATVRFDLTGQGFRAQIIASTHTSYIEPFQRGDLANYVVFNKADYRKQGEPFYCGVTGQEVKSVSNLLKRNNVANISSGGTLRTYRLALAATGEYTAVLGGTVLDGLSGIVTTMNRVNGIYERELAVRMVLVANNDLLVYTNGATDPYDNNVAGTLINQNQTNVDAVIGTANYDIGHVFSTGGGGLAGLGVVCSSSQKARGITGSANPIADAYDVDYVAHEMGHQFSGNHTFNGSGSNCSGGNRNAGTAYEPGSGITIQAYAGICSADNTQPNSEDYFHRGSLNEMLAFTTGGGGASCGTLTTTTNTAPTVSTAAGFTIPKSTPFTLTATGSDPNGDSLTYIWEQFDLGAANATGVLTDAGTGPLFRSFIPTTDPTRTFPSLRYILNNANVAPATAPLPGTASPSYMTAELLPSTNRTMNFSVTARDNRAGGGGTYEASTTITVTTAAGPFAVTVPNTAVSWAAGSSQTVTWNVASTNLAPVNTTNVEIALSLDGGYSFPVILAASTPNDGSEVITIPAGTPPTTQARVRVAAVGNVFFDISDSNFTITGTNTAPTLTVTGSVTTLQGASAATAVVANVSDGQDSAGSLSVSVSQVPPDLAVSVSNVSGSVSLSATAGCGLVAPTTGTKTYPVLLTVTDSAGAKTSQFVNILVGANLIPTLGTYGNISLVSGNSATSAPTAPPADGNSNLVAASVSPLLLPGSLAGAALSIASNGTVTVNSDTNTIPGVYTVRAQANDSCGAARVRQFTVTVTSTTPSLSLASSQVVTGGGYVLPNQCNQLNVTLSNAGGGAATAVSATLSTITPGVTLTQPTAAFADIPVGQNRTSLTPFQFSTSNSLTCGSTVNFTLTVNYTGAGSPRSFPLSFTVGAPASAVVIENFDSVAAPALPAGWTTARTGAAPPAAWATTTVSPDSAPNVAFTNGVGTVASSSLITPAIVLPASTIAAVISFRHAWNFEVDAGGTYDGGVVEISTDGGTTYQSVAAIGGSFLAGGYNATITTGFSNPLAGVSAWGGLQASYVTSSLQLPLALNGQTIRLRFRAGWDNAVSTAGANWRIDGLSLQAGLNCAGGGGACGGSTFTVGGTVSGLVGTGLVLRNNGGDNLNIAANGSFTFATPLATGATYAVTVLTQPGTPSQTCTVSSGSGTVASANVTDVAVTCSTNTFTVGGTVSGLVGTGLVLRNNGGNNLSIAANGAFTFSTPVASGASYAVTVLTQPGTPSQTCTVGSGTGTVAAANVTNVAVTCSTNTFTIGGTVSGLVGTGLVLRNNGGNDLSVAANGAFTFTTPVASGASYAVTVLAQPGTPSQTCTVGSGTGTVAAANVISVAVTCTTNTFSIGGTVSGLVGTGLVLRNNGGNNLSVTVNGAFTFTTPVASGASYAVTVLTQPGTPSQTCTVGSGSGTVAAANVTSVAVTCSTNTFTVGGTVSGLVGTGLVLRNNGGNDLSVVANGAFTFSTPVASGATYSVTVLTQPGTPSQTCTVGSGSGTVAAANVTSVTVTCATNTFTVGGTVSGLVGTGLVLRNNGGNDLSIAANGAFTFSTPVASGATYSVTVFTQPGTPIQTCAVGSGSGTVTAANITGVTVACVLLPLLNIDDSDAPDVYSPSTDGILLMRYLLGLRGSALTQGIVGTNARRNASQIETHIATYLTSFDVDGDGTTRATTDGLLILRRLLGLSGPALTSGARNSNRSDTDVGNAIDLLKP